MIQPFEVIELPGEGCRVFVRSKQMFWEGVSLKEIKHGYTKYLGGYKIQDAFPFLSADQREFLMTGLLIGEDDG